MIFTILLESISFYFGGEIFLLIIFGSPNLILDIGRERDEGLKGFSRELLRFNSS